MSVLAICSDCNNEHPLGMRPFNVEEHCTTQCPSCGSTQYETVTEYDGPSAAQIRSLLENTSGLGETTIDRIERSCGSLTNLLAWSESQFIEIDGIGEGTASNVVDNLNTA